MRRTVEVEIDSAGEIRPVDPTVKLPVGRAVLIFPDQDGKYPIFMPGESFADWFTQEEDAAWDYLKSPTG